MKSKLLRTFVETDRQSYDGILTLYLPVYSHCVQWSFCWDQVKNKGLALFMVLLQVPIHTCLNVGLKVIGHEDGVY